MKFGHADRMRMDDSSPTNAESEPEQKSEEEVSSTEV
jgi:hypothetical protein